MDGPLQRERAGLEEEGRRRKRSGREDQAHQLVCMHRPTDRVRGVAVSLSSHSLSLGEMISEQRQFLFPLSYSDLHPLSQDVMLRLSAKILRTWVPIQNDFLWIA